MSSIGEDRTDGTDGAKGLASLAFIWVVKEDNVIEQSGSEQRSSKTR